MFDTIARQGRPELLACICQRRGGTQLLLVDNVAAFYWLDRASQPLPACAADPTRDAHLGLQQAHACIAAELQALMRTHRLAVIATKQAVLSASNSAFDRYAQAAGDLPYALPSFLLFS